MGINQMQFGFITVCGNTKCHLYLETVSGELFSKKKNLYFVFVDLETALDCVSRDVVWLALRNLGIKG